MHGEDLHLALVGEWLARAVAGVPACAVAQVRFQLGGRPCRQAAVDVVAAEFVHPFALHYLSPRSYTARSDGPSVRRIMARARCSRERIVPTGQRAARAASS